MNLRGKRDRFGRESCANPLSAAVVAALVALAPAQAIADTPRTNGTIVVANCNDNGAGSLRQAIVDSPDGGTVDLTALACSMITLGSNLHIHQNDLDIIGPGSGALSIDAGSLDRAFVHAGAGLLTIDDLAIANGAYRGGLYYEANGGCLFSNGSLALHGVTISGCTLTTEFDLQGGVKTGGCVSVMQSATLVDTRIEQCTATANDDELDGGGVYASGVLAMLHSSITGVRCSSSVTLGVGANSLSGFTMKYSTIENNVDVGDPDLGYGSQGGGVQTNAPIYLYASTIAQNHAAIGGGALFVGEPIDIGNSTIAANTAVERAGVTIINSPDATIANSTIAFNHSDGSTAGGLGIADSAVAMLSTIISNNTSGAAARDVGSSGTSSVSGAHNLIRVATLAMPPDTLTDDPLLRPLYANGGTTRTIALSAGSPAIEAGANLLEFDNDQRGPGFERLVGDAVDIGALEYRAADSEPIFWDGFDV